MAASLPMQADLPGLLTSSVGPPYSHLSYIRIRARVTVRGAAQHCAIAMADSPRIEAVAEKRLPRPPKPHIPIPTNLDTIVVEPKGEHKATIVWLHGLGQSGSKCAADIESYKELQHPHIKWILPTAPLRNVDLREGLVTAWYNATSIFKEGHFVDLEGLDKTAERVVNFLLKEQPEDGEKKVKVAVGGFSQGCATALYITKCSLLGKYSNGNPFPLKLDAAMAFGGWMPTIKTLEEEVNAVPDARQSAGEIPMYFGHCEDDNIMPCWQMDLAVSAFHNVGANNITSKTYSKGGHSFIAEEAVDVLKWLVATLELETLKAVDETPDFVEVKDPVNEDETGDLAKNATISECSEQQSMMPIDGQHTNRSITVL